MRWQALQLSFPKCQHIGNIHSAMYNFAVTRYLYSLLAQAAKVLQTCKLYTITNICELKYSLLEYIDIVQWLKLETSQYSRQVRHAQCQSISRLL